MPRRCRGLAAAGGGRQAGRQLGVVGRAFSPLSSANPDPRFQAALQSPRLLRHCAQSARSGRKDRLPPSGLGLGDTERWEAGLRVRGEARGGSLTPSRGNLSSVYSWSHREQSWASRGALTPSTSTNRWRPRGPERFWDSTGDTQQQTSSPVIPNPHLLVASKQKPPGPSPVTAGSSVTAERKTCEPRGLVFPPRPISGGTETPSRAITNTSSGVVRSPCGGAQHSVKVHSRHSISGLILHLYGRMPAPFLHDQRQNLPTLSCAF